MKIVLIALSTLISVSLAVAQTDEPIHVSITAPAGASLVLDGTLTLPVGTTKPIPVLLLIAGSGPTDRDCNSGYGLKTNAFKMLADSLTARGIAVARYDKRGSGTNLKQAVTALKPEEHQFNFYVGDAVDFIRQLQADKRFSRVIVAGHSEGSLVGMMAARQTNSPGFISLEGAGRNIAEVMKAQGRLANPPDLQAQVDLVLDSLRAGYTVHPAHPILKAQLPLTAQPGIISWMKYDQAVELKAYAGAVLIVQGKHDKQVAMIDAETLKAARPDARLVVFETMNHILKNAPDEITANFATYNQPDLPLTPGLASLIADFAKKVR
ncbi:MAG: alpha/beta fold hydrolase [Bacteroidetes bacterium]|nr:alpha/beta fold hydrolase [Fibrella sp.]